ncbi:hypothetical protein VC83_03965 [Pseudogymnoascus destructans]|uniref:Carboxylesterase type B domain-containing protein n=2 Tax=Pseudogymnoascus destructans TaxID=655981 RepID=L8G776_PSED2|nr:uncharacterized protein VC83_03965 [Pseudogymnoascus destructans]ELR09070.1 hypothetical protein GMDG_03656 [Pseudogymnoascus destructans 20631-21]OAF59683.1 hypothetical protein VC83_03965 [Pseudogymnoascus destructans]
MKNNKPYRCIKRVFFLAVLGVPELNVHPTKAPTAKTKNGTYVGLAVPQLSQDIFRGIPFAQAPRFELAQSLNSSWSGTHEAIEPGLTCSGYGTNNLFGFEVGEDCLNLMLDDLRELRQRQSRQ